MELKNINIREEYYGDIHSMKPKWWMRWGILVVFLVVFVIFILGYVVKYPDVLHCEIRLATHTPSITLPLATGSQIENVFIKNKATVFPNENLVVIKNNAYYNDVMLIERKLNNFSFQRDTLISFFKNYVNKDLQLGSSIENDWIAFSNELLLYYKIEILKSYQSQIHFLDNELVKHRQLRKQYQNLIVSDQKQKALVSKKATVDSILYAKGITSRMEYNTTKQYYYAKNSELEQNSVTLNRINLDIVKLEDAKKNQGNNEQESLLTQQLSIKKTLNKLKSSIATWKKNYVLVSPIKGKVSFIQNIENGKFYEGAVLTIVPMGADFYATINIPIQGAGKLNVGQKVILKLNDYPYREFGVLEGKLIEYNPVANKEGFYLGKVQMKAINLNLLSSYGKKVKLNENMAGIGEIITNDRNILDRLFETILYAFRKK